jgi:hypothetical protein
VLPEVVAMTPQERLAAGRCPECGVPLVGLDLLSHRATHWLVYPADQAEHQEARTRFSLLTDEAKRLAQAATLAEVASAAKLT